MNILYYLHGYPPASFVINELYELEKNGHNVAVFSHTGGGEIIHSEAESLNIPVAHAGRPSVIDMSQLGTQMLTSGEIPQSPQQLKNELLKKRRTKECCQFISKLPFNIDHVHVHFPIDAHSPALRVADRLNLPCTGTAHAYEIFVEENLVSTRDILTKLDRIIVPSRYNKAFLENDLGIKQPVDYVPASIRIEKFTPTEEVLPRRIFTVSRLVEKKGFPTAIKAVNNLVTEFPELEYHIVGGGPQKGRIKEMISTHNLKDTISLLGRVSDKELINELDKASIFVLPCQVATSGDRDAMPVVLKEAMAMKTACVSTYTSAVPELITHEKNGLLSPARNVSELEKNLRRLLSDERLRKNLATKSRETVEQRYNIETEIENLINAFEKSH
jgi:glycosyltransferase involved in cell wall biosynthesis